MVNLIEHSIETIYTMAILKKCEIHYLKADPKRPNSKIEKKNPTWEVQLRTSDPAQKDEWVAHGLPVKLMVYKVGHAQEGEFIPNANGGRQWRLNLKKRSLDKNGDAAPPPEVVGGGINPIDPNIVGNGSIANVRIYQYDYKKSDGTPAKAGVLMGLQITKHIVYRKNVDEFEAEDMETFEQNDDEFTSDAGDAPTSVGPTPSAPPMTPGAPQKPAPLADARPEDAF